MNIGSGLPALTLVLMAGCGSSAMSPSKLAASESSVRGAEEVGAQDVPKAGLYLKLARDELAQAKASSARGDGDAADRLLARAQADGDLANALAKEASARGDAQAIENEVANARKEIE